MTMRPGPRQLACATVCTALLAASGCTTTSSTQAKTLKGATSSATSLADCEHLTVANFPMPAARSKDANVGVQFAQGLRARLAADFGPLFKSVESGEQARGLEHECLVRGEITKYKPGSRAARFILVGLGAASLEGSVSVTDASGKTELLHAPFDKLWAWGGIAGASKGINDMVDETVASAAATIAHGKGWNASK